MPQFRYDSAELERSQYVLVAASQTTAQISTVSDAAKSDYLHRVVISPATSAAGVVSILDGTTVIAAVPALLTGALDLKPFSLELGVVATTTKGFVITTGANISALAVGRFNR